MTLTSYNFRKGVDVPQWEWMTPAQVTSQTGSGICSDGVRYIYYLLQSGTTTTTTASTTQLWRFDTWTNGWHFLVNTTNGNAGMDIDYDPVRNLIWIVNGVSLTSWAFFNLNLTSVTLLGQTVNGFSLSTSVATVLPAAAASGSSIILPNDLELPPTFDSGKVLGTSTATVLNDNTTDPGFNTHMIGCYVEYTSGTLSGQRRVITSITNPSTLVTAAFSGAPAANDTYKVVLPQETATSATTTTIVKTGAGWVTNRYANSDVEIISGTGASQRRRIASNDTATLTLSTATAGNPRTGPWSVTPDATSVFVIKTSSDFLYYQVGGATAVHRLDILATTPAWTAMAVLPAATGGGADLKHPKGMTPFSLLQVRGAASSNIYIYDIGLNTWSSLTHFPGGETITTGATTVSITGKRKMIVFQSASQRALAINLATGQWDAAPALPYASPSAFDGKRCMYMKSVDGVEWIYFLRAGGTEFFRVPLEWL